MSGTTNSEGGGDREAVETWLEELVELLPTSAPAPWTSDRARDDRASWAERSPDPSTPTPGRWRVDEPPAPGPAAWRAPTTAAPSGPVSHDRYKPRVLAPVERPWAPPADADADARPWDAPQVAALAPTAWGDAPEPAAREDPWRPSAPADIEVSTWPIRHPEPTRDDAATGWAAPAIAPAPAEWSPPPTTSESAPWRADTHAAMSSTPAWSEAEPTPQQRAQPQPARTWDAPPPRAAQARWQTPPSPDGDEDGEQQKDGGTPRDHPLEPERIDPPREDH